MKKVLAVLVVFLVLTLALPSLTGCGSADTTTATTTTTSASATTTPLVTTRSITDMVGRELVIPAVINKVLATGPVEMELVYLIAPDKLAGLCFTFNGDSPLVSEKYTSLPVIGGWFGTQTGNYETFIAAEPDIILEGQPGEGTIAERQEKFGSIPVVCVTAGEAATNYQDDSLTEYESEIRFLGELLGEQERAEALITYYKEAMEYVENIVAGIPEADRVKVYYAEGKEGFSTDPVGSMHTRLLEFCGGLNVADVELKAGYGMAETSLEQIAVWDPDMIIIGRGSQASLYETITTNSAWTGLRAVKNGQVFLRPDNPFSWFDGPPGPCQIVGMYWMINTLYPEQTAGLDLESEVKEFYSGFFHYDLTDAELSELLGTAGA